MFLSSHEKQLDAKRRLLVPQDFRASAMLPQPGFEPFEGLFCIASVDAPCLECGGGAFFSTYRDVIAEYPKLSPTRKALEQHFYGAMHRLAFDTAGRVTLPEKLCQRFGFDADVVLVGLGDSFQIWTPKAYDAHAAEQERLVAAALLRREDLHG